MAVLNIPDQKIFVGHFDKVQNYLNKRGIVLEKWNAKIELKDTDDQATVLKAYEDAMNPLMKKQGYQSADVISIHAATPNLPAVRTKFFTEHTHSEDEVRFFVDGEGIFWFNLGKGEPVFSILCQRGDLLSVPTGVKHWFDFGPKPHVKAIRLFTSQEGWVANYTGSGVDGKYNPSIETYDHF